MIARILRHVRTESTKVRRNDPKAPATEKVSLFAPHRAIERKAVQQKDRRSLSEVVVSVRHDQLAEFNKVTLKLDAQVTFRFAFS